MVFRSILFFLLLIFTLPSFAQIDDDLLEEDTLNLKTTAVPELDAAKKEEKELRKVKKKKNFHFGHKTKRTFTKRIVYQQDQVEIFSFVKIYVEPSPYLHEIYWYDKRKGMIVKTANANKIDKTSMRLLNGPYYRKVGDVMLDSGAYYLGARHHRWEHYASNGHLSNKFYYNKGWLKHSQMTYYDNAGTKIKEVIPIHNGKKRGTYYLFYENGNTAIEGKYDHDAKVGKWMEYYPNRFRKKEIQYPNDPLDTETDVAVINEWDENGKIISDEVKNLTSETIIAHAEKKNNQEIKNIKEKSEKVEIKEIAKPKEKLITEESSLKIKDRLKKNTNYYTMAAPGMGNIKTNRIASDSPIGKELLGRKAGEIIKFKTPSGEPMEWEILEIY